MAISAEYGAYVAELLAPLGGVEIRRMFGGAGLFKADLMFGLIVQDSLYFKVDAATLPAYEAAGTGPFSYQTKSGRRALASYYQVPETLLDEPEEIARWAREAVEVAIRSAAAKPVRPAAGQRRRR